MGLSLFNRVKRSQVASRPFPHVVIENALPEELHEELRETFPTRQALGVEIGQNERWSTSALTLGKRDGITPLWREFVQYHASKEFLDEVVDLFGELIVELYPKTFLSLDDLRNRPVTGRTPGTRIPGALHLDAQVSGNTPAIYPGAPRGIHFDSTDALWAGLYYLRSKHDDSIGGDLQLWEWPESYSYRKKSSVYKEDMNSQKVRLLKTVPYRSNAFVFFINSINSLHSVTERMPTPHTRQFLNLLCDVEGPLFRPLPLVQTRIRNRIARML